MTNSSSQPAEKHGISPIQQKDQRTQAEKDKQQAAQKQDNNKSASAKQENKSGSCN